MPLLPGTRGGDASDAGQYHRTRRGLAWVSLSQDFHWHIEVLPRRAEVARLHREEEFYVNPLPPEEAARQLREMQVG